MNIFSTLKTCVALAIVCVSIAHSAQAQDIPTITTRISLCGISVSIPKELALAGETLTPCVGSYKKDVSGAMLTFAIKEFKGSDTNWIDRQPTLHVYARSLDDLLRDEKFSKINLKIFPNGKIGVRHGAKNCGVQANTKFIPIEGHNWQGWLAEDNYEKNAIDKSKGVLCKEYTKINRCVSLAIGNKKMSITMNQYCLTRNPDQFDLDDRLSFKIFMEFVKSLQFDEE